MTKCNIKDNITKIISKLKLTANLSSDTQLAQELQTDKVSFSYWKNKKKIIPIENLIDFCNKYEISLDWILRETEQITTNSKRKNIRVPLYADFEMQNIKEYISLPKTYTTLKNLNPNIVAFISNTDEFPQTCKQDDILFFDLNDNFANQTPDIFWISANGIHFIRRVSIMSSSQLLLSAENKHITDEQTDQHNIEVVARLIGVLKWKK